MLEMLEDMEGAGLGGTREQAHISIILKKSKKLTKATICKYRHSVTSSPTKVS